MAQRCSPDKLTALYRQLGIPVPTVQQVTFDNKDLGILEASIAILQKWRQIAGRHATSLALVKALESSKNCEVAHKLEEKLKKNMKTSSTY